MWKLKLKGLPQSVNHSHWFRQGRKVLTKKSRDFREMVCFELHNQGLMDDTTEPMKGKLMMLMCVRYPDKRKRDLDNLVKSAQDALQSAGVFVDDSQIRYQAIFHSGYKKGGETTIRLMPMPIGGFTLEYQEED